MKKFILFLCIMLMSMTSAFAYKTADENIPIDILVNGSFIKAQEPAFIEYDTVYVPIRFVSDALGAEKVIWDEALSQATVQNGTDTIVLYEGRNDAYVNGKKVILSASAKILDSRLFVPARFIAESFGATVKWDSEYYNVVINKNGINVDSSNIDKRYTNDEVLWLARIISAESASEPANGKIGVGNVVLNRVRSKNFPNTIYNVIFDKKDGVQFEPVINGTIYNTPTSESVISAKRTLRGENTVGECLYFFNPKIATSSWIEKNRTFYKTINNHDFYL